MAIRTEKWLQWSRKMDCGFWAIVNHTFPVHGRKLKRGRNLPKDKILNNLDFLFFFFPSVVGMKPKSSSTLSKYSIIESYPLPDPDMDDHDYEEI